MKYTIELTDEQDKFLAVYNTINPTNPPKKPESFPQFIIDSFVNTLMQRKHEFAGKLRDMVDNKQLPKDKLNLLEG